MSVQAASQAPKVVAPPLADPSMKFAQKIAPDLAKAAASKPTDAIVFFKTLKNDNVHSAVDALAGAEQLPRGAKRKETVFNALQDISQASAAKANPVLEALQKSGAITGVDSLWAFNAVRVRGASLDALKKLAGPNTLGIVQDSIVAQAELPSAYTDPIEGAANIKGKKEVDPTDPNAVFIDWGTMKMNAPAAWAQGITGAGIVVGGLDTGVIPEHPGLKANFRGTQPDGSMDLNYNWFNGIEKGSSPIDDVGHGTHTIGSVLGNDSHHITGVAPDAKFVAVRGLGQAGGSLFNLMAGMQWMIAPTDTAGNNPRPDLAPDIVTNSWGGGPVSNPFLWSALRNWKRAGIVPVFASGNARNPKPAQVAAPGMYTETITVGASDKDDTPAWFSMYGPSKYAAGKKPEITAPGVKIYSTTPDGQFHDTLVDNGKQHDWSGTSMATPHVAGAVALYLQAHPNASFTEIEKALMGSGTHPDAMNEHDGAGRVQVDKLIAPGTISKDAKLTDPARVKVLMDQVAQAHVYPGDPVLPAPAAAKPTTPPILPTVPATAA